MCKSSISETGCGASQTIGQFIQVNELPYYNTKVEPNMKLPKSVKLELQAKQQYGYKKSIQQIAETIA